ncbi:MAG: dienelactone hydrolase family protein [Acidimicrobiales bacterium]
MNSQLTPLSTHEPTSPARGALVVVQEAFGVTDHIEDVARRLAAAGWLAIVPHLYHRTGDARIGYDDMPGAGREMSSLTADGILDDIDTALAAASTRGFSLSRVGIVGFCMGGSVALAVAARRDIGAAVTFYGGGVLEGRFGLAPLVDEAIALRCPWLGLYGDLDHGISPSDVEQLREAAAKSGQPVRIVRYPDAGHGFNCDARASYHEQSALDAWQQMLDWFDEHMNE